MTSKPDYNFTDQDKHIIDRYRRFNREYFENEFMYESRLFMMLNKVRDMINNSQMMNKD